VFVFLLSLLVILQQSLSSGYLNSVITTIEKRYEIPSSVSGIIASMYEIGNVFTVIFVSYLGSRRHIPAFIGVGAIVMGFSSILFALPHFLSDSYSASFAFGANITDENICQISGRVGTKILWDEQNLTENVENCVFLLFKTKKMQKIMEILGNFTVEVKLLRK